jgi:hypothetical protein
MPEAASVVVRDQDTLPLVVICKGRVSKPSVKISVWADNPRAKNATKRVLRLFFIKNIDIILGGKDTYFGKANCARLYSIEYPIHRSISINVFIVQKSTLLSSPS